MIETKPEVEWKEFGTCYRVSNYGVVQSNHTGQWVDKKLKKSKTDYLGGFYMTFCVSGGRHIRLHRFMWETFKGPIPKGYVVDHEDGDRTNCAIWNLEAKTQKKNIENLIARGNFRGGRRSNGTSKNKECATGTIGESLPEGQKQIGPDVCEGPGQHTCEPDETHVRPRI